MTLKIYNTFTIQTNKSLSLSTTNEVSEVMLWPTVNDVPHLGQPKAKKVLIF
jgi:cysteinyl-tRNA synthetase